MDVIVPRPDSDIIPIGAVWFRIYNASRQVVAIIECADDPGLREDVAKLAASENHVIDGSYLLINLALAGIPYRVLTPRSDPKIAQYITHLNARVAALTEATLTDGIE